MTGGARVSNLDYVVAAVEETDSDDGTAQRIVPTEAGSTPSSRTRMATPATAS